MDTIKINSKNTKIIAHRGLSGIELENTMKLEEIRKKIQKNKKK